MFEITATIVIYKNERQELLRTIQSFLNTRKNVHLFLVDNSPTDELKDISDDPRVEYLLTGKNIGFGSAHNIILKKVDSISKYHILLNPDMSFLPGTIEALYDYMESNSHVGLSTADIILPNGIRQYACRLLPTPVTLMLRRLLPKHSLSKDVYCNVDYTKPMNVPCMCGCFMFLRTSILKEVGYFDSRFFMYCEDIDYSRRIHEKYDTIYNPMVKVSHEYHRESSKNLKMLMVHALSAFKYFNKWGWFFDKNRSKVNQMAVESLQS